MGAFRGDANTGAPIPLLRSMPAPGSVPGSQLLLCNDQHSIEMMLRHLESTRPAKIAGAADAWRSLAQDGLASTLIAEDRGDGDVGDVGTRVKLKAMRLDAVICTLKKLVRSQLFSWDLRPENELINVRGVHQPEVPGAERVQRLRPPDPEELGRRFYRRDLVWADPPLQAHLDGAVMVAGHGGFRPAVRCVRTGPCHFHRLKSCPRQSTQRTTRFR